MSQTQTSPFEAMRIFFAGVGGQGTLLATRLVGEAALLEDLPVVMSEIHGMAQRGGVVESTIVVGDLWSPVITNGEADILLAFEPLEALRALPKCTDQSWVVLNTVPIIPFTVATGQGTYPELESIYQLIEAKVQRVIRLNANELAREAGTERASNVALIGTFAGTGQLPISRKSWETALKKILPPRLHEVNLRAFLLGFEAAASLL